MPLQPTVHIKNRTTTVSRGAACALESIEGPLVGWV